MIEKFEIFIKRMKRKVNKKVLGIISFMVLGFFIIFSLEMSNMFKSNKDMLENTYNRSMFEMIGYIKNVDLQFKKLNIANDSEIKIRTLTDIWRQSSLAKDNLNNLPLHQGSFANTSKFLSQTSDYSYMLIKNLLNGNNITDKDYENINKLSKNANELLKISNNIFNELNNGKIKWNETYKIGNDNLENYEDVGSIISINKVFKEYEGLIYDGAFSEHITNRKPKLLEGLNDITIEEGKNIITKLYNDSIENIEYKCETNNIIDLFEYNVKLKNNDNIKSIAITKKGGKIYSILSDKNVAEVNINVKDAQKLGYEFLNKIGINDVKVTYSYITENLVTINYAGFVNNVIYYPDLVKVKVALDNGEICSLESNGYIFNHHVRNNLNRKYNIYEAKKLVNNKVKINEENIAIIPTDSLSEILTYEFKGTIDNKECIIYINCNTLKEEKILMIIETKEGILTM